jgi:hypothetical protein
MAIWRLRACPNRAAELEVALSDSEIVLVDQAVEPSGEGCSSPVAFLLSAENYGATVASIEWLRAIRRSSGCTVKSATAAPEGEVAAVAEREREHVCLPRAATRAV